MKRGWPSTVEAFGAQWTLSYLTSDRATYELPNSKFVATISLSRHRGVYFAQLGAADTKGLKASLRSLERTTGKAANMRAPEMWGGVLLVLEQRARNRQRIR